MLMCAPLTSRSGYGDHARDLFYAFNRSGKYDIKVIDVRWGECPRNALNPNDEKDKQILDCILSMPPQIDRQPDIYIDIRIPNEFETYGKFNIGITAGVETTAVSSKWIEGCNKMDLIIVPSEHSKGGFVNTIYDKIENLPDGKQQKVGEHKLQKPIEVLFEGVDDNVFKPLNVDEINDSFLSKINEIVSEKFAFLHVGQWTQGSYGEDRKDIAKMIKVFYESFANKKKQPALILKTNGATFSIMDKEDILNKINQIKSMFPSDWKLPNVYLLHGDMTRDELNELYNHPKVKSFVSFTHGEGFGRPLLEATMAGLPVISSNWSGHLDFLSGDNSLLIGGELNKIPKSIVWKDVLIEESQWFVVDDNSAYRSLNYAFENQGEIKRKGKTQMYKNRDKFTLEKMADKLDEIMSEYTGKLPSQVSLNLPKLKKVESKKPPKINLPKLKKLEKVT